MLGNSWTDNGKESISRRVMGRIRPEAPLKNKIDVAQKMLQLRISKLDGISEKLQKKHDAIFEKIVNAQRNNKLGYAHAYASELAQVRKMKNMISGAKLSMEQINMRLETVTELGDMVVTLSPCMSVIKGLGTSLNGIMPEMNTSMQDLSQVLGDVMSGASVESAGAFTAEPQADADTRAILEEATSIIAGQTKSSIPEVPDALQKQILKKTDVFI